MWLVSSGQIAIATGYALSGGLWRQHSWGLEGDRVIEPTAPREKYFGFVLTEDEAAWFADLALGPKMIAMVKKKFKRPRATPMTVEAR
jgi:hypothetical protein